MALLPRFVADLSTHPGRGPVSPLVVPLVPEVPLVLVPLVPLVPPVVPLVPDLPADPLVPLVPPLLLLLLRPLRSVVIVHAASTAHAGAANVTSFHAPGPIRRRIITRVFGCGAASTSAPLTWSTIVLFYSP